MKLQTPMFAGNFESYWHFHHGGRRFGHWLGCSVIVSEDKHSEIIILDRSNQLPFQESLASNGPVDLTMKCSKLDTFVTESNTKKTFSSVFEFNTLNGSVADSSPPHVAELNQVEKVKQENELDQNCQAASPLQAGWNWKNVQSPNQITVPVADLLNIKEISEESDKEKKIENVTQGIAAMTIYGVPDEWKDSEIPVDLGEAEKTDDKEEYCSDSDNISVISGSVDTDATEPSEEFVVIPMPQCFNCEQDLSDTIPVTQPISVEIPKSSSEESVQIQESDNNNNMELKPYPEIPICIPVLITPEDSASGNKIQLAFLFLKY